MNSTLIPERPLLISPTLAATDIATDGTLAGPNLEALRTMAASSSVPVIASGGIGCMADLLSLLPLEPLGVSGVIVGRALYDGRVDLAEAAVNSKERRRRENDGGHGGEGGGEVVCRWASTGSVLFLRRSYEFLAREEF